MNNKRDLNELKKTANIILIILKMILILSGVGLSGCILGIMYLNFASQSTVMNVLNLGDLTTSMSFGGLNVTISDLDFSYTEVVKALTVTTFSAAIVIVISTLSILQLIKIIKVIKNGAPFTIECVKSIKKLGVLVIITSIVVPLASSLGEYFQINMFNLESILLSCSNITGVQYDLFSFDGSLAILGVIILILSKVFEYGCYLQDEYDSTL